MTRNQDKRKEGRVETTKTKEEKKREGKERNGGEEDREEAISRA